MKSLRLLGRSTFKEGPRARRAVFVSVLAFLLVGGSFLPGPAVNSRQQFAARPRPVPSKVLIGAEAAKHARGRMLALPKDNPARRGYELMLERLRPYGADPDQMLAAQFATPKTRTGALKERVLGFMGDLLGTPAHAEYYQDGTFEMYLTPFESDSYDGTAEFNVYVYDSDTGAWAVSDLQLHTADDAPGNAFDASTGWNSSIALNCRPPLEHARQGPLGFFAPSVLAQTWQEFSASKTINSPWDSFARSGTASVRGSARRSGDGLAVYADTLGSVFGAALAPPGTPHSPALFSTTSGALCTIAVADILRGTVYRCTFR
jgi:hypothetical protein